MPKIKRSIKSLALEKITKQYGGVSNFASFLGVKPPVVSSWLTGGVLVPIKHALAIEILTQGKFKARELRPDIMKQYELVAK